MPRNNRDYDCPDWEKAAVGFPTMGPLGRIPLGFCPRCGCPRA